MDATVKFLKESLVEKIKKLWQQNVLSKTSNPLICFKIEFPKKYAIYEKNNQFCPSSELKNGQFSLCEQDHIVYRIESQIEWKTIDTKIETSKNL